VHSKPTCTLDDNDTDEMIKST